MDHLIESTLGELEQLYPQCGEENTDITLRFTLLRRALEDMIFRAPNTSPDERTENKDTPRTKAARMERRRQRLLVSLEKERERGKRIDLTVSQVNRYEIIVRLKAIQALEPDPSGWAYRKIQETIDQLERGEVQLPRTKDQIKLEERRATGEIDAHDFDLNAVFERNQEHNAPITRKDVGNQAIVIARDDFSWLKHIRFINRIGDEEIIDADSLNDPVFILFPEELGE